MTEEEYKYVLERIDDNPIPVYQEDEYEQKVLEKEQWHRENAARLVALAEEEALNSEIAIKDRTIKEMVDIITSSVNNQSGKLHFSKYLPPERVEERLKKEVQEIMIQRAITRYQVTKNLDEYIVFWESLWEKEGLYTLKQSITGAFALSDLYILSKRYDDAENFIRDKLMNVSERHTTKANKYLEDIYKWKNNCW